jgi:8-oxo-dGTP diphosphatase
MRDGEILLAMKKRGFGEGKWNGMGGKVEEGEDIVQAAIRETEEEVGVTPLNPERVGFFHFKLLKDGELATEHDCNVYIATEWEGEPTETEEMRPQWFKLDAVPYGAMWVTDRRWLPLVLSGQPFKGKVTLDGDRIVEYAMGHDENA